MSTNHPKAVFSLEPSIFFDNAIPIKIPNTENAVKMSKRDPSRLGVVCTSPINPINDFAAIMNKEVPTANFMGILAKITSAGIIRNPPPAPTKPVSTPTKVPSNKIIG